MRLHYELGLRGRGRSQETRLPSEDLSYLNIYGRPASAPKRKGLSSEEKKALLILAPSGGCTPEPTSLPGRRKR